jgi:hypothetical protein
MAHLAQNIGSDFALQGKHILLEQC